jgi:hypothetical protein
MVQLDEQFVVNPAEMRPEAARFAASGSMASSPKSESRRLLPAYRQASIFGNKCR